MPVVYGSTGDGYVANSNGNFSIARDAATGSSFASNATRNSDSVKTAAVAGRGGGTTYALIRTFMYFDFRGQLIVPESATLNIYGYSKNSADIFELVYLYQLDITEVHLNIFVNLFLL